MCPQVMLVIKHTKFGQNQLKHCKAIVSCPLFNTLLSNLLTCFMKTVWYIKKLLITFCQNAHKMIWIWWKLDKPSRMSLKNLDFWGNSKLWKILTRRNVNFSPIRTGLVLSGDHVWFWNEPPTSEFCVVHSHGISKACNFTRIYRLISRIPGCQGFESPVLWSN